MLFSIHLFHLCFVSFIRYYFPIDHSSIKILDSIITYAAYHFSVIFGDRMEGVCIMLSVSKHWYLFFVIDLSNVVRIVEI